MKDMENDISNENKSESNTMSLPLSRSPVKDVDCEKYFWMDDEIFHDMSQGIDKNSLVHRSIIQHCARAHISSTDNKTDPTQCSVILSSIENRIDPTQCNNNTDSYFWIDEDIFKPDPENKYADSSYGSDSSRRPSTRYNIYELTSIDPDFLQSCEDANDASANNMANQRIPHAAEPRRNVQDLEEMSLTKSSSSRYRSGEEYADASNEYDMVESPTMNGNVDKDTIIELLKDHMRALQNENEDLTQQVEDFNLKTQSNMERVFELQGIINDGYSKLKAQPTDHEELQKSLISEPQANCELINNMSDQTKELKKQYSVDNELPSFKERLLQIFRGHNVNLKDVSETSLLSKIENSMNWMALHGCENLTRIRKENDLGKLIDLMAAKHLKQKEIKLNLPQVECLQVDSLKNDRMHECLIITEDKLTLCMEELKVRDAFTNEMLGVFSDCNNVKIELVNGPDALFKQLRGQLNQFVANYRFLESAGKQFHMPVTQERMNRIIEEMLQAVAQDYSGPTITEATVLNPLEQLRAQLKTFLSEYKALESSNAHFTLEFKASLKQCSKQQLKIHKQCGHRLKLDEQIKQIQQQLNNKSVECSWYETEFKMHLQHIDKLERDLSRSEFPYGEEHLLQIGSLLAQLKENLIRHVSVSLRLSAELHMPQGTDTEVLDVQRQGLAVLSQNIKNQLMRQIAYINRLIIDLNLADKRDQSSSDYYMQTLVDELQKQLNALENKNMHLMLELESMSTEQDNYLDLRSQLRTTRDELYNMKYQHLQLSLQLLIYKDAESSKERSDRVQSYKQYAIELEDQLSRAFDLISDRNHDMSILTNIFNDLKESLKTMEQKQQQQLLEEQPSCKLDFAQLQQKVKHLEQELTISHDLNSTRQSELHTQLVDRLVDQQQMAADEINAQNRINLELNSKLETHRTQVLDLQDQLEQQALLVGQLLKGTIKLERQPQQLINLMLQLNKKEMALKVARADLRQCQEDGKGYVKKLTSFREQVEQLELRIKQAQHLEKCRKPIEQQLNQALREIKHQEFERHRAAKHLGIYKQWSEDLERQLEQKKSREKKLLAELYTLEKELRGVKTANFQIIGELRDCHEQTEELHQQLKLSQDLIESAKLVEELSTAKEEVDILKVENRKSIFTANYYQKLSEQLQKELIEKVERLEENPDIRKIQEFPQTEEIKDQLLKAQQSHQQWPEAGSTFEPRLESKLDAYRRRIRQLEQELLDAKFNILELEGKDKQDIAKELEKTRRYMREQDFKQLELSKKLINYKMRLEEMVEQRQVERAKKAKVDHDLKAAEHDRKQLSALQDELKQSLSTSNEETDRTRQKLSDLQNLQLITLEKFEELKYQLEGAEAEVHLIKELHSLILKLQKKLDLRDLQVKYHKAQISAFERASEHSSDPFTIDREFAPAKRALHEHMDQLVMLQHEKQSLEDDVKSFADRLGLVEQELSANREEHAQTVVAYVEAVSHMKFIEQAHRLSESKLLKLEMANSQCQIKKLHLQLDQQKTEQPSPNTSLDDQKGQTIAGDGTDKETTSLEDMNSIRLRQNLVIGQLRLRISRLQSETTAIAQREHNVCRKYQGLEIELAKCNTDLNDMRNTSEDLIQEREHHLKRLEVMNQSIRKYKEQTRRLESDIQKLQEQDSQSLTKNNLICESSQTVLSIDPKTTGRRKLHLST